MLKRAEGDARSRQYSTSKGYSVRSLSRHFRRGHGGSRRLMCLGLSVERTSPLVKCSVQLSASWNRKIQPEHTVISQPSKSKHALYGK